MQSAVVSLACMLAALSPSEPAKGAPPETGASVKQKVRVALELAKTKEGVTKSAPSLAPAPRPVVSTWQEAKAQSVKDGLPVVVYIGCEGEGKRAGVHEVSLAELGNYKGGTAVVFYPVSGQMYAETAVPCGGHDDSEALDAAISRATKKTRIGPTAPRKLDWK